MVHCKTKKYKGKLKPSLKVEKCPRCNQYQDTKKMKVAVGWFNAPISFCETCYEALENIE
jgi:hypothetical protein